MDANPGLGEVAGVGAWTQVGSFKAPLPVPRFQSLRQRRWPCGLCHAMSLW